jgi:predicted transposase/invertase (TIGR01784 family)
MKFLDVKTDFVFKKVFGSEESKDLLLSFLNAVLYRDSPRQIADLTIVAPYSAPLLQGIKDTFVDVKARLDDGSQVIVEMQVLNHAGLEKRVLYTAAKHYAMQLQKGDDYSLLNPVVALTIVNFNLFDPVPCEQKSAAYLSRFKLLETQTLSEYNGDIELVFIELPKFIIPESNLNDMQDRWIYFIKNAWQIETIPQELSHNPALQKAFAIINEANMSPAELDMQHKRKEFIMIQRSAIEKATDDGLANGMAKGLKLGIEQGIEQGLVQGIEQGQTSKALDIARGLLEILDNDKIASITGLTLLQVAALRT